MSQINVTLSAFGDEIDSDLDVQLKLLQELDVLGLDLRGAWGTNVVHMTDEFARKVRQTCDSYGITVQCLGSPIGKSPLVDPIENELNNLDRIMAVGEIVGTRHIRMFSFYPPDMSGNAHYDQYVPEVIDRLGALAEKAQTNGFLLLLENEKEIVTDVPERCQAVLSGVDNPNLRFIWDPANFVQCGVASQVDTYWGMLSPYIGYVHVKDALLADGRVKPAGEGDGQLKSLLLKLKEAGYQGVLSLEPHLALKSSPYGYTGAQGMTVAVTALRKLLDEIDD